MSYKSIVYVKLFLDLFDDSDRFLYQLTETQQLLFIKLLYLAGRTENRIPDNPKYICDKINYQGGPETLQKDISRIMEIFPKLCKDNGLYSFSKFEELHNFIDRGRDGRFGKTRKENTGIPVEDTREYPENDLREYPENDLREYPEGVSRVSQEKEKEKDKEKEKEKKGVVGGEKEEGGGGGLEAFISETQKSWNALCLRFPVLPSITKITPKRRAHLKVRFANKDFVSNWGAVLLKIPTSPFLLGMNDRKWVVNFDFLVRNDESYVSILEGKYNERKAVFR